MWLKNKGWIVFKRFSQLFKLDWKFQKNQPTKIIVQSIVKGETSVQNKYKSIVMFI